METMRQDCDILSYQERDRERGRRRCTSCVNEREGKRSKPKDPFLTMKLILMSSGAFADPCIGVYKL